MCFAEVSKKFSHDHSHLSAFEGFVGHVHKDVLSGESATIVKCENHIQPLTVCRRITSSSVSTFSIYFFAVRNQQDVNFHINFLQLNDCFFSVKKNGVELGNSKREQF
jgi:hypothetical protein